MLFREELSRRHKGAEDTEKEKRDKEVKILFFVSSVIPRTAGSMPL